MIKDAEIQATLKDLADGKISQQDADDEVDDNNKYDPKYYDDYRKNSQGVK